MTTRPFWAKTAISMSQYLRVDRDTAGTFEIANAAGNVILISYRTPQTVSEFVRAVKLLNGESRDMAVERAIRTFTPIEKSAVRDYCKIFP